MPSYTYFVRTANASGVATDPDVATPATVTVLGFGTQSWFRVDGLLAPEGAVKTVVPANTTALEWEKLFLTSGASRSTGSFAIQNLEPGADFTVSSIVLQGDAASFTISDLPATPFMLGCGDILVGSASLATEVTEQTEMDLLLIGDAAGQVRQLTITIVALPAAV